MKRITYVLIALALVMVVFNATMLNFDSIFEGQSMVALIGIAASLCAICLLLIFHMSRMIDEKTKDQ